MDSVGHTLSACDSACAYVMHMAVLCISDLHVLLPFNAYTQFDCVLNKTLK